MSLGARIVYPKIIVVIVIVLLVYNQNQETTVALSCMKTAD